MCNTIGDRISYFVLITVINSLLIYVAAIQKNKSGFNIPVEKSFRLDNRSKVEREKTQSRIS